MRDETLSFIIDHLVCMSVLENRGTRNIEHENSQILSGIRVNLL